MKHLLLVEDDKRIATEIVESLEQLGFVVTHIKTLAQASAVDFSKFSICVIDWHLPDGEGIDLVKSLRQAEHKTPVLILTANREVGYRKQALDVGANDFLGKPFYFHELQSRLEILLEEPKSTKDGRVLETESIRILKKEMRVFYNDKEVSLAKKEFELLQFFASHPGLVFTRNELLDAVWGSEVNITMRTVDSHVLNLRKKLHPDLIQTVWSSGYRFNDLPKGEK